MTATAQFPDENSEGGEFVRQDDAFRDFVSNDNSTSFPAAAGRYHLYVSFACPWAHRTIIVRELLGLQDAIGMTVVDPVRDERGWAFRDGDGYSHDPVNGFKFLREAYLAADLEYRGRVTVPVLWDQVTRTIVNNSEDDICRMFAGAFRAWATKASAWDLFPAATEKEHAELAAFIYANVNNGVYRAGFATTQKAYEAACRRLFQALDELDARLANDRYLFGRAIVEADLRLFCTLVRFDAVYHGHFKCNLQRISDYANLSGYLRDIYQLPGVSATVNLDHIKRHYYVTHTEINPSSIVPLGPVLAFSAPHGRERMS